MIGSSTQRVDRRGHVPLGTRSSRRISVPTLAATAMLLSASGALATEYPGTDYLTGDWGGVRDELEQQGFRFFLNYTTEPMWNVAGGEERGGTYLHNVGADFHIDLARVMGVPSTTLLVKLSKRDGDSVSAEYIAPSEGGNIFPVQEIFGGQTFKVANVQFNTSLLDDRLQLAYGRIIANDDFLRSDLYCQFLNNAFCGSPKGVFFQDPFAFSAYPSAQWGFRARLLADPNWTIQAAVYDADINLQHGDPNAKAHNKHGDSWSFGNNGVVLAGEIHYNLNPGAETALPGVYKVGGYWMNGDYRNISQTDGSTVDGSAMIWLLADQMLFRAEPGTDRGLWGFATWVKSLEDKVNLLDDHLGVGLVYKGPFRARPKDSLGLAFTRGWISDEQNTARLAQGLPHQTDESVYELNYRFVLGRGVAFEPDLQYIQKPAATGQIPDAWALGAKVTIDF